jgi:Golgi phosphoprotein 3
MNNRDLRLHHELLLLALHDSKGTNLATGQLDLTLAGALFCELVLEQRVELKEAGRWRGTMVEVTDTASLGDEVLDDALARLSTAKRRANTTNTVHRLSRVRQLRGRTAEALCRKGILRETEDRVLLLFRRRIFPTVDPGPERALIERIRRAVEDPTAPVDARTAIVVTLAQNAGVLGVLYDRKARRAHKARLGELRELSGEGTEATRAAIEAVQAAMVGVMAATAASTSAST